MCGLEIVSLEQTKTRYCLQQLPSSQISRQRKPVYDRFSCISDEFIWIVIEKYKC